MFFNFVSIRLVEQAVFCDLINNITFVLCLNPYFQVTNSPDVPKHSGVFGFMGNALTLHTEKQYSVQDEQKFVLNAYKAYKKTCKKPHGGTEIDIRHFIGKNLEYKKSFALLLLIKKQYVNSMIYDYSEKSLSEKMNISQYITGAYINRLLKAEYCQFTGKKHQHLQFVGLDKIMPERSKCDVIQIEKTDTINTIVEKINLLLIKNNFANQDKLRKIKSNLINTKTKGAKISKSALKKCLKFADLRPEVLEERLIDLNVIGMRKIAQILGSSIDYAARFIKKLVDKKLISIKRIVKKYADFSFAQFSSDELKKSICKNAGYFYSFNGCTFHHMGTSIEFIK